MPTPPGDHRSPQNSPGNENPGILSPKTGVLVLKDRVLVNISKGFLPVLLQVFQ